MADFNAFPFVHRLLEEVEELARRSDIKQELERIQYQNGLLIGTLSNHGLLNRMSNDQSSMIEQSCNALDERLKLTAEFEESDRTLDRIRNMLNVPALDKYTSVEGKIGAMLNLFNQHFPKGIPSDQPCEQPATKPSGIKNQILNVATPGHPYGNEIRCEPPESLGDDMVGGGG